MLIVAIDASPVRGVVSQSVEEAARAAETAGATVVRVRLSDLSVHSCTGCGMCRYTGACKIPDDLPELAERIGEADGVIFGLPSYFRRPDASTAGAPRTDQALLPRHAPARASRRQPPRRPRGTERARRQARRHHHRVRRPGAARDVLRLHDRSHPRVARRAGLGRHPHGRLARSDRRLGYGTRSTSGSATRPRHSDGCSPERSSAPGRPTPAAPNARIPPPAASREARPSRGARDRAAARSQSPRPRCRRSHRWARCPAPTR